MVRRGLALAALVLGGCSFSVSVPATGFVCAGPCGQGLACVDGACVRPGGSSSSGGASNGNTGGSSGGGTSGGGTGTTASTSVGGSSSTGGTTANVQFVQDGQSAALGFVNASTLSAGFASSVASGDLLVAAVTYASTVGLTVTLSDTFNNQFLPIDCVVDTSGEQNGLCTFYAAGINGGPGDTITANFAPATSNQALYVAEYSGLAGSNALAAHTMAAEPNSTTPGEGLSVSTVPVLVWGFSGDMQDGEPPPPPAPFTPNRAAGFTARGPSSGIWLDAESSVYGGAEDLLLSTAGTSSATWNVPVANDFVSATVAFRAGP